MADERDILWGMYQEHCTQGRHHEDQRATMTNLIIAVAAAVIGLLSFKELSRDVWPLSVFLTLLGFFGALFSLKHYERFRYHMKCAAQYRNTLEKLLPDTRLRALREAAKSEHAGKYKIVEHVHPFIFWMVLNFSIAMLGAVITLVALTRPSGAG